MRWKPKLKLKKPSEKVIRRKVKWQLHLMGYKSREQKRFEKNLHHKIQPGVVAYKQNKRLRRIIQLDLKRGAKLSRIKLCGII